MRHTQKRWNRMRFFQMKWLKKQHNLSTRGQPEGLILCTERGKYQTGRISQKIR